MNVSKLRFARCIGLALGAALAATPLTPGTAFSQGGYMGQRATQDRDYSRLHAATQRAYGGKTDTVTLKTKKNKRHTHKKRKHHRKHHSEH